MDTEKKELVPFKPVEPKARTVVQIRVVHQLPGEQATEAGSTIVRHLESVDEVYSPRKMIVTGEWRPLDLGWLADPLNVGLIYIENLEGTGQQVIPTPFEQQDIDKRVVEVSTGPDSDLAQEVPPLGFYLGTPVKPERLLLRCRHKTARCRIKVYPK